MRSLKFEKFLTLRNSKGISKKGQAAMEFLMTYGWAILVVLVAIGALAYFGVLSPGKFLPESCLLSPGFACTDFKVVAGATSTWTIKVQNGLCESLTGISIKLAKINDDDTISSTVNCLIGTGTLPSGSSTTCSGLTVAGSSGDRFKAEIQFAYTPVGGIGHTKVGSITAPQFDGNICLSNSSLKPSPS